MKVYGNVTLSEGSDVKNLTVAHGNDYPANANEGEIFYHHILGLSYHDGTTWRVVGTKSEQVSDGNFGIDIVAGKIDKIIPEFGFQSGSTKLFVGGLRQKRGIDYTEEGTYLKLNFDLTSSDIDNGINIVVDYTKLTI